MAATVAVVGGAGSRGVEVALRACAVAGVSATPIADGGQVTRLWRSATAVLVATSVQEWVAGLPRRPSVAVLDDASGAEVDAWRFAVQIGAEAVFVPEHEPRRMVEWLALAAEPRGPRALVLGVAGVCGGAGASTLAAAVALRAATSATVTLLDADAAGGGVDVLLGIEGEPGARWPDLAESRGVVAAEVLGDALPRVEGLAVLSWRAGLTPPLPVEAMDAVLSAAVRGSDLVVIDLPRVPDSAATRAAMRCDHLVLVAPASVRAVAAGAAAVARWSDTSAELGVAVRHPGPADLTPAAVAEALGIPLLEVVPNDARLSNLGDRGRFVRALRRSPVGAVAASIQARLPGLRGAA